MDHTRFRRHWRALLSLAAAGTVAGLCVTTVASATSTGLTYDTSSATVTNGDVIDLTAKLPLADVSATVTDSIVQKIDPTKTHLRSIGDIVIPFGWTLQYSFDNGATWTSTAPTTATGTATSWDKVNAVKASGDVHANGTLAGKQVMAGSASLTTPLSGTFTNQGSGGDGWGIFFDDNTHVFNVYHHTTFKLTCATRTGGSCGGGWPFGNDSKLSTGMTAYGAVDDEHHHIWVGVYAPTSSSLGSSTGFVCVDITTLASPAWCGGTIQTAYHATGAGGTANFPGPIGPVQIGTRLYQWDLGGKLDCLDMAANGGAGAACTGQPYSFTNINYASFSYNHAQDTAWSGTLIESDGKIYGSGADAVPFGGPNGYGTTVPNQYAICFDPVTNAACTGWSSPKALPSGEYTGIAYELGNSNGDVLGVCWQQFNTTSGHDATCFKPDGTSLTQNSTLAHKIKGSIWNATYIINPPTLVGTRLYWSEGRGTTGTNTLNCYDTNTDLDCSGGWPITGSTSAQLAYTLIVDRLNSACLWKNDDANSIRAINAYDTSAQVCGPPPDAKFGPEIIVPRLSCSATGAITGWRHFTNTSPAPAGYDYARLNVFDSNGVRIPAWTNKSPDSTDGSGNPVWDLTTLSITDSGQAPTFNVTLYNRAANTAADPITASLEAVGETPELCLSPVAVVACPTAPGPFAATGWSQAPTADADSKPGSDPLVTYDQQTVTVGATGPANNTCGAELKGRATTATGGAIPNATVALLDSNGDPILVPAPPDRPTGPMSATVPATTTTDSNGYYTFGYVTPGSYKVKFVDFSSWLISLSNNVSGYTGSASGPSGAAAGAVVSGPVVVAVGTNGVVDATYNSSLPATGSNPLPLVLVALGLLALGAALTALDRRRRLAAR